MAECIGRAIALLAAVTLPAHGQESDAFRRVDLAVGLVADAGARGALHRYWQPRPGFELTASAPFHVGTLEAGLQHNHHDARRPDVPGFRARLLFLGWREGVTLAERVAVTGGVRLGMYEMRFDGDTIPAFRRDESELGVALRSMVEYRVGARWHAQGAATYQVVFTHEHIEQLLVSAGVSRTFSMPSWLHDFLD